MRPEPQFRSTLFNLDKFIAPRLIRIFYGVGLIAIAIYTIWAIISSLTSGPGGWILLLPVTFITSLVAFILLRIFCEGMLVYFKSKEEVVKQAEQDIFSARSSIFEDVRDAFEELMKETDDDDDDDLDIEEEKPVKTEKKSAAKPRARVASTDKTTKAKKSTPKPKAKPKTLDEE